MARELVGTGWGIFGAWLELAGVVAMLGGGIQKLARSCQLADAGLDGWSDCGVGLNVVRGLRSTKYCVHYPDSSLQFKCFKIAFVGTERHKKGISVKKCFSLKSDLVMKAHLLLYYYYITTIQGWRLSYVTFFSKTEVRVTQNETRR